MHEALKSAVIVVALLSPEYLKSDHCQAEWMNAIAGDPLNRNGRLVLLRVAECEPPGLLTGLAYWDLVQIREDRALLADVVRKAVLEDHHDATPIAGPYWRAPRSIVDSNAIRPTPCFTGRDSELDAMSFALKRTNAVVALHGMGGTGKSSLAREYARRNLDQYAVVWWLNANTESEIIDGFVALGSLFVRGLDSTADRYAAAQHVLSTLLTGFKKPVLLIFENLQNESDLIRWRPRQGAQILVTSRKANWGGDIIPISVNSLPIDDAARYLRSESTRKDLSDHDIRAVAEKLGGLPLAMAHAAQVLKSRRNVTAASYLERITARMDNAPSGTDYPRSVFATFQEQLTQAEAEAPGAVAIISLIAFFSSEAIPEKLFQQLPETYPTGLMPTISSEPVQDLWSTIVDPTKLEDALGALDNFSLIQFSPETRTYDVHRLVQAVARQLLGDAASSWSEAAIMILSAAFPEPDYANWGDCAKLVPHARVIIGTATDRMLVSEANLLKKVWDYLYQRAQYSEAEFFARRALLINERVFGSDHRSVALSLNDLARLYSAQARYAEAENLFKEALSIDERVLGSDHFEVAELQHNLANMYEAQGRYEEAEALHVRSLEITEGAFEADHLSVASSLAGLAGTLIAQGRYAEAEPMCVRALAINERNLGPDHVDVAMSVGNLAFLMERQGRYEEAEPLCARALAINERVLGLDHLHVSHDLNDLAAVYEKQGRYLEAEPLFVRSLAIRESALGSDHPSVGNSLNNLAMLYESQKRYIESEALYLRASSITERALGTEHQDFAVGLNNLAYLYFVLKRYKEAESLYVRALSIYDRVLGPDHPCVAESLENLASLYEKERRYKESETLLLRALAIYEHTAHPNFKDCLNRLVALYESQGYRRKATALRSRF